MTDKVKKHYTIPVAKKTETKLLIIPLKQCFNQIIQNLSFHLLNKYKYFIPTLSEVRALKTLYWSFCQNIGM